MEVEETIETLHNRIRVRFLASDDLPKGLKFLGTKEGLAYLEREKEFLVGVSLRMGEQSNPDFPIPTSERIKWSLFELEIRIAAQMVTRLRESSVEDDDEQNERVIPVVHSRTLERMVGVLNVKMRRNSNPLLVMYESIHKFCTGLQMQVLRKQASNLHLQFGRNGVRTSYKKSLKKLTLTFWPLITKSEVKY